MDRAKFFVEVRKRGSGVFGTKLTASQVAGIEALLDASIRHKVTDKHHVANVLAQVYRETGGRMAPVRETFADSDAQAISRLERAWKAGKLKHVKTPYWRDSAFGRGPIQLTHWAAYEKFAKRLGVPLREKPQLALDPKIGADIAVIGMKEGLFTGKKLADYKFPSALKAAVKNNPRRIVNGKDGSDGQVAGFHRAFAAALDAAGFGAGKAAENDPAPPVPKPRPEPKPPATPAPASPPDETTIEVVQRRLVELGYTEVGGVDGKLGPMTRVAILAFRADNGLPLSEAIDPEFVAALDTAKPRKLAPARENATDATVRDKVPEAKTAWYNKLLAPLAPLWAFVAMFLSDGLQYIGIAKETLAPIEGYLPAGALMVIVGIAVLMFINARKGEATATAAFKSGARR